MIDPKLKQNGPITIVDNILHAGEIEELDNIIDKLTFSKYMDMLPHINKNFEIAKKYINPDNLLNKFIVALRSDSSYNTKDYFIC